VGGAYAHLESLDFIGMSRISRAEVERVAHLARLRLDAAEAVALTRQLEAILDYVALLDGVDTEGVPATSHVMPLATPFREDVPGALLPPEVAVANAPAPRGSAFTVPRVLDDEAEG
jgi:aspartyl-tRNA(Asn)/glutamyl-tRNA(Gln) amidotransferase subunit C